MRALPSIAVTITLLTAMGCGDGVHRATTEPEPTATSTVEPARSDPLALVGRWYVDAEGVRSGSAVRLGEGMTLFLECGVLDGSWRADAEQGLFIAHADSGDGGCFSPEGPQPQPWLRAAVRFRVDGDRRLLLDADGRTTAVLRGGATPTVGPNRVKDAEADPTVSPAMRAAAEPPAPLPAGATAPTAEQLQRRWLPADGAGQGRAFVSFSPDGEYTGSDGCNGQGGRYVLGTRGRILATTGPQTLIGCEGAPLGSWVHQAARAGLVDDHLVLYDAEASVIGELVPAPAGSAPSS